MHKARSSLAQNAQNLRNEMQATERAIREKEANISNLNENVEPIKQQTAEKLFERKNQFDSKANEIRAMKQGFAPPIVYPLSMASKAIGYATSNRNLLQNEEDEEYVVEGPRIEKMLGYTNLESERGFKFFQTFLKDNGILDELEALGIQEGDTVRMYGLSFSYYKE